MSLWALAHFFSFIVNLLLSVYIVWKDWKRILNWICAATTFLFAVWSFGTTLMRNVNIPAYVAFKYNNIAAIGWMGFSAYFLLFSLQFYRTAISKKKKLSLTFNIVSVLIALSPLFFLSLQWNGIFMSQYRFEQYGWVGVWPASLFTYIFYVYYISCVVAGLIIIYSVHKKTTSRLIVKQCRVIIVTVILSVVFGSVASIGLRHAGIYAVPPLGDVFTVIFAAGIFYATARYRLFVFTPASAATKILETMSDGVLLIDTRGLIVECNRSLEGMLQYGREELIGKPFTKIISEKSYNTKFVKELLRNKFLLNIKGFLKKKDGNDVPVLCSAAVITDEGEIAGFVMVVHDYTELLNAEMRLLRLLETAKTIIDWLPFGVLTCSKNGLIRQQINMHAMY